MGTRQSKAQPLETSQPFTSTQMPVYSDAGCTRPITEGKLRRFSSVMC